MKVNGLIEKPRWYDIPCKCNHNSIETEFPIMNCLHCKFEESEKSIPKNDFTIKDEKGNDVIIKEVTIVRGNKYQDVIGWTF